MYTSAIRNKNNKLSNYATTFMGFLLLLIASLELVGCNSSSSTPAPLPENADGYFTGSATVKAADNVTDLSITDLQGMVSGNRFMFMSVEDILLYDGTFTSIVGKDFTGTVNIYKDGVLVPGTTTVAGTVTGGSSIVGTLTGVGLGNGNFTVTYSTNNLASSLSRVAILWTGWYNKLTSTNTNFDSTRITDTGIIGRNANLPLFPGFTVFTDCVIDKATSTVLPISDINVYSVNITVNSCNDTNVDGDYTGFATTQDASDQVLNLTFSNGTYSATVLMIPDGL